MATTKNKKFSLSRVISLILMVLPIILEFLDNGREIAIQLTPDVKTGKVTVEAVDASGELLKSKTAKAVN